MEIPDHLLRLAETWSPLMKAMGDPTRLKLLVSMHYAGPGQATVSELAAATDLRPATASAALKQLATMGIIEARRSGREVYYTLIHDDAHQLIHYFGGTHAH